MILLRKSQAYSGDTVRIAVAGYYHTQDPRGCGEQHNAHRNSFKNSAPGKISNPIRQLLAIFLELWVGYVTIKLASHKCNERLLPYLDPE
ncbi:MAG: hypothetical protein SGJ20_11230 [Planctomycetota bacterium]|nr:hypothetical protein [Planctomycetota bacterium]